ncbi:MAG TPA: tRNA (5-methylaminomethyl-2-thiouridine)(34)-methyltransferase MnmD [Niabella sp.]|jgi:tRNA U34 5-methylaminomethyl-2-thiouridine-forming methyltransferase MnmC|nr:tRNA (5-methylaminomethyl-2-thiouridine)(34)-methyltransferase MnmD [Chitinophagaceae bacterium]HRO83783.1 tRNA (5-methylaminomethyl-2-thiouridine)(34)-methyltransferase MnmD [Niabella sp.]
MISTTPEYKIINTDDNSHTIQINNSSVTFHSTKGAIQESNHVFISAGLNWYAEKFPGNTNIRIFEVGFGTGLNALLTATFAKNFALNIEYQSIDLYPLSKEVYNRLNFAQILVEEKLYYKIMTATWNEEIQITDFFNLLKINTDFQSFISREGFDVVYFDAFAPEDQPELWTEEVFKKVFHFLNKCGVLVTYCSKSIVRKRLENAGFSVTKLPGPPGKREITRAIKI